MRDFTILTDVRSIHGHRQKLRVTERIRPLGPVHIGNRHRPDTARVIVQSEPTWRK